jgi:hypothetical protein
MASQNVSLEQRMSGQVGEAAAADNCCVAAKQTTVMIAVRNKNAILTYFDLRVSAVILFSLFILSEEESEEHGNEALEALNCRCKTHRPLRCKPHWKYKI